MTLYSRDHHRNHPAHQNHLAHHQSHLLVHHQSHLAHHRSHLAHHRVQIHGLHLSDHRERHLHPHAAVSSPRASYGQGAPCPVYFQIPFWQFRCRRTRHSHSPSPYQNRDPSARVHLSHR